MTRRSWIVAALSLSLLIGGVAAWSARDDLWTRWWVWQGSRALAEDDLARIADCEAPDWHGSLRLLLQDLDTTCGEAFAWESVAERLRSAPRKRWMRTVAREGASPRMRVRASLALILAGDPAEVAALRRLIDPALAPAVREAAWRAVAEGALPETVLSPRELDEVRLLRFEDSLDDDDVEVVERWLARSVAWPSATRASEGVEAWLAARLDPDEASVRQWSARRAAGLPVDDHHPEAERLARIAAACAPPPDRPCASLRLALFQVWREDRADDLDLPPSDDEPAPALPVRGSLALLHGDRVADEGERILGSFGRWVAAGEGPERVERLRHVLLGGARPTSAGDGDPVGAVLRGGGDGWALVAAAAAMAAAGPFEARLEQVEGGFRLRLAEGTVAFDTCGRPLDVPAEGRRLELEEILAQASLVAAQARPERSAALRAFAARLAGGAALVVGSAPAPLLAGVGEPPAPWGACPG